MIFCNKENPGNRTSLVHVFIPENTLVTVKYIVVKYLYHKYQFLMFLQPQIGIILTPFEKGKANYKHFTNIENSTSTTLQR